jgi:hypothetical protein
MRGFLKHLASHLVAADSVHSEDGAEAGPQCCPDRSSFTSTWAGQSRAEVNGAPPDDRAPSSRQRHAGHSRNRGVS